MIEARVITPGRYWTVYDRKQYLGSIAFREGVYAVIKAGVLIIPPAQTLDDALKLFEFPVTQ